MGLWSNVRSSRLSIVSYRLMRRPADLALAAQAGQPASCSSSWWRYTELVRFARRVEKCCPVSIIADKSDVNLLEHPANGMPHAL